MHHLAAAEAMLPPDYLTGVGGWALSPEQGTLADVLQPMRFGSPEIRRSWKRNASGIKCSGCGNGRTHLRLRKQVDKRRSHDLNNRKWLSKHCRRRQRYR